MICRKNIFIGRGQAKYGWLYSLLFEFDSFNCFEKVQKFKGKVSVFPIFEFFHAYGQSNQSVQNKNSL